MDISLKINNSQKIRYHIIHGTLDIDKIITYLGEMNDQRKQDFDMNGCWDLSEADVSNISIKEMEKLIKKGILDWQVSNDKKLAFVVSSKLRYGIMRMYQTLLRLEDYSKVKIFYDRDETEKWLMENK